MEPWKDMGYSRFTTEYLDDLISNMGQSYVDDLLNRQGYETMTALIRENS